MKLRTVLAFAVAGSVSSGAVGRVGTPQDTPAASHVWQAISYPPLPIPGAEHDRMHVRVSSGGPLGAVGSMAEPSHLRFDLEWSGVESKMPKAIANPATIHLRFHTADGKISAPDGAASWGGTFGGPGEGGQWSLTWIFPWSRNALDEAWFEFHAANQAYWVELPYGFARNPADAERSDPTRGAPQFPPSMKTLGDQDILVPWLHVDYDLGEIQNGWRLSLQLSNPFDAHAEAMLYRDDFPVGSSRYLWKLDSPRTAMAIQAADSTLVGRETAIRLPDSGRERRDLYDFDRHGSSSAGRAWGTATIQVEDKSYAIHIPSSLFKLVHGVTDPGNKKRLHAPSEPAWER